jgi:hypothetical protein
VRTIYQRAMSHKPIAAPRYDGMVRNTGKPE